MNEPRDAVPLEERYRRKARAAAGAAAAVIREALPYSGGTELLAARYEAVGRIAAALILADREES